MKKLAIATVVALAATAASALEIGTTVTRDYSGAENRNGGGITIGQTYGATTVAAGFERFQKGSNDQDRFSLVAAYNVAKLGPVSVAVKGGAAYLDNQTGQDGYAALVGVGVSAPVTKAVAITVDATRQYGQDRVKASDGNRVAVGLKYRF